MIRRIAILGTGLIGASVGLALRRAGFAGPIFGWDRSATALLQARELGAVDPQPEELAADDPFIYAQASDLILLAGPVFAIAEWLEQLAPVLGPGQVVTDVGSVKRYLVERAAAAYNGPGQPCFLPGHPMAGKEQSGAAAADGALFEGAAWLFTPSRPATDPQDPCLGVEGEWRSWITRMGARPLDLEVAEHDRLCALVSHVPQMLATSLAALLDGRIQAGEANLAHVQAAGGRALREMTRLGASPFSMWRDIAHTNAEAIEASLLALEQEIAHLRENLRTPELKRCFEDANRFRRELAG